MTHLRCPWKFTLLYVLVCLSAIDTVTKYYCQALLLALHKLKISEEQRKSAIDAHEPLVAFALSCGMYSSPAVCFSCNNPCVFRIFGCMLDDYWIEKIAGKSLHC